MNPSWRYHTGQPVRVGDRIRYDGPGRVVFVVDDGSYAPDYPKEHWSYLRTGIGIVLDDGNMFVLNEPDEDLELICATV